MSSPNKRSVKTIAEWESKKPPRVRWEEVETLLRREGFKIEGGGGSAILAYHDKLRGIKDFEPGGALRFHKGHEDGRETIKLGALKSIIHAIKTVWEQWKLEEHESESDD